MPSPIDDPSAGTVATIVAVVGGVLLGLWRFILGARKDLREDQAQKREVLTANFADSVYRQLVDSLKDRVEAMDAAIEEISTDYRKERAARMEAEDRAVNCERDRGSWELARQQMLASIADCEKRSEEHEHRAELLEDRVAALEARLRTVNGRDS